MPLYNQTNYPLKTRKKFFSPKYINDNSYFSNNSAAVGVRNLNITNLNNVAVVNNDFDAIYGRPDDGFAFKTQDKLKRTPPRQVKYL